MDTRSEGRRTYATGNRERYIESVGSDDGCGDHSRWDDMGGEVGGDGSEKYITMHAPPNPLPPPPSSPPAFPAPLSSPDSGRKVARRRPGGGGENEGEGGGEYMSNP
jgi:hypothetical protein